MQACSSPPEFVENGNPGHIRIVVFNDDNRNLVQDGSETGAAGQIGTSQGISCPARDPSQMSALETDASGKIRIEGLAPGNYCVQYIGSRGITTRLTQEVPVSSDQASLVIFGLVEED
jgi:hypothetical protein